MASRKLIVEILGDSKSLERAFSRSTKESQKFGASITKSGAALRSGFLVAGAAAAVGIGAFAIGTKKAIGAASDLNESINKNSVVFGNNAAAIEKWSETTANALGISQAAALEAASSFGQMLQTAGVAGDASADMSKKLVTLAADMASFSNIDPSEALEKLRSGLAGEAEPLRRYGVFLSEAAVKTEAYRLGIAKSGQELTEAQKVQARYSLIMRQTAKQQGDFARTSTGLANAQRRVKAELQDASARLGRVFLPVVAKATAGFADFLGDLAKAKGVRAKFAVFTNVGKQIFESIRRTIANIDWEKLWDAIVQAFRNLGKILGRVDWDGIFHRVIEAIRGIFDRISAAINAVDWQAIGQRIGNFLERALSAAARFVQAVDWSAVGKAIARRMLDIGRALFQFLRGVNWKGLAVSIIKLIIAVLQVQGKLLLGFGRELGGALVRKIGEGLDAAKQFVIRKFLEFVNDVLGTTKFLGRFDPFKGVRERVQKRLNQMKTDAIQARDDINSALGGIKDQTVQLNIQVTTAAIGPGGSRRPEEGRAGHEDVVDRATKSVKKQADKVAKGAKTVTTAANAAATSTANAAKDAKKAREKAQKAFDSLIESLELKVDQAQARGALKQAQRILQQEENAIRARIRAVGRTTALLRQLFQVNQAQSQIAADLRTQAKDRKQKREFRALGLGPTGEELPPTIPNLRKQFAQIRQNIAGTPADTRKIRNRLAEVGRVLSKGWEKAFGKLSPETRALIRDWFADMRSEMKDGGDTLKPVAKEALNVGRVISGLGLTPEQTRKLRGRLVSVTKTGSTVSPMQRASAFGMIVGPAPVTVENTIILDGKVLGRSTKRFLDKSAIHSPKQKRGPNAGI